MNRIPFTISLPNQPYVDDFSEGLTAQGYYTGLRYLKVQVRESDGLILEIDAEGETLKDLNSTLKFAREGNYMLTIDATEHPWEAAYLANHLETDITNYREELGTTDADGNPEFWEYSYSEEGNPMHQIYYINDLWYKNEQFVRPKFRAHQHSQEKFWSSVQDHIEMAHRELARGSAIYSEKELQDLETYKNIVENLRNKYGDTLHWKIKFPDIPLIKP
jgi:hypothetical protein